MLRAITAGILVLHQKQNATKADAWAVSYRVCDALAYPATLQQHDGSAVDLYCCPYLTAYHAFCLLFAMQDIMALPSSQSYWGGWAYDAHLPCRVRLLQRSVAAVLACNSDFCWRPHPSIRPAPTTYSLRSAAQPFERACEYAYACLK